ncbi:hypothetical protein N7462_003902 [Penicillium macrosclerotiorum]|uniref:uncharacterized protein n=1 Tax=Penicillium macrosclerotiorum TaxID=303699 RepID=UPI00254759A2|nr:uncharacterized protein N7462_003902 [Penicillium macrosclerotiorum]KAJ5689510.1 hypothetical protein N7462_003902 [Penicillium macrosclerotiorum]
MSLGPISPAGTVFARPEASLRPFANSQHDQAIEIIDVKMSNEHQVHSNASPPVYSATPLGFGASGTPVQSSVWWVCCHCSNMVNPILADERCPICGHCRGACCGTVTV